MEIMADRPGRMGCLRISSFRRAMQHWHALDDMNEIAGSVIGREQSEHTAGAWHQPLYGSMICINQFIDWSTYSLTSLFVSNSLTT